jgi:hypothetical protein
MTSNDNGVREEVYHCEKHMNLCAQKLKMHCAYKLGTTAVCAKLKAMSNL